MTVGKVDEVVEISLVNYRIRGNIELTKVDKDYPDNKLTGAEFEVYADTNGNGELDKDDELLGKMTELDGGVYQMKDLLYGKYFVKETKAPEGFLLDDNVYPVSIEENGKTYTVENEAGKGFLNEAQKGSLKIVKTSSDGKVEGFSFRVIGNNGYDQTFNPYVCWYCKGGDNYYWGCYCNELSAARESLSERYNEERSMPYNNPPAPKQKSGDDRER